jgi:FtsP/CotA-like multicopper oxidase with cupredoxin domain
MSVIPVTPAAEAAGRPRSRFWRIVRRVLIVLAALLLTVGGLFGYAWYTAPVDTVGKVPFEQPLAIPPLAESHVDDDGRRVFDLTAQQSTTELMPGTVTETWGYNGGYLGPTLRAERGEDVVVNVTNNLDETTTVHWHGMHLPAAMDGGPHQPIAPGETWSPSWTIDQPAATLWYHPHPHGETEDHIYRGLAGLLILDDPDSSAAKRLPHDYGVDDIPVIVQDKRFDDGDLTYGRSWFSGSGRLGGTLLVNGTYGPYLDVTTELVRLRLLNASTARVYDFGFSDDREFDVVATDGGLLPGPVATNRIMLSPGERAEIWAITNRDRNVHNFHVHDTQFQIADVDGHAPPTELAGWKDTVLLRPNTTTRIALRFSDYTDPDVPYMYHCHLVYHEDQGMMGQFVVVGPEESTGDIDSSEHSDH